MESGATEEDGDRKLWFNDTAHPSSQAYTSMAEAIVLQADGLKGQDSFTWPPWELGGFQPREPRTRTEGWIRWCPAIVLPAI
jgi:hypothetical protein